MNSCNFLGRLTKEPVLSYSKNDNELAITRYTIAVDRRFSKDENAVDFIKIVAFGKAGEFASKYFHKGKRVLVQGRLQIGSYTNTNGVKVETYKIIAENQEFADAPFDKVSKKEEEGAVMDGFTTIPENVESELPFNE